MQVKIKAYQQKKANRVPKKAPAAPSVGTGSAPPPPPAQHRASAPPPAAMTGGGTQHVNIPANVKVKNDKGTVRAGKGNRKRISKSDISGPSNFV